MVNVEQYIMGIAVAAGALFSPINANAYKIKLVKEVYTPHDRVAGGCFRGAGIENLEYQITFNKTDIADFMKINREVFLTKLAIDINREIWENRRNPSHSDISRIIDSLKKHNPSLKKGKLTVASPLTYKVSHSVGSGLVCSF